MSEDWISAYEAFKLVLAVNGSAYQTSRVICSRAHAGMIEAKAASLIVGDKSRDDAEIPKQFWWACGEAALEQDWRAGDFETWIDKRLHFKAFGVSFSRRGIEAIIGPALASQKAESSEQVESSQQTVDPGGRPPASWWDDLWVEICRQLYVGDLHPKRQADITSAMMTWASANGHEPAESTIRERARKLWTAISKDAEN